jgi:hypothetical protein
MAKKTAPELPPFDHTIQEPVTPVIAEAPTPQPAPAPALELTPEEIQAVLAARAHLAEDSSRAKFGVEELAKALTVAIEATRPPQKKNPFNRKKGNPWLNKDGSPKPKLKRVWLQHGREMDPDKLYADEIEFLNQAKPGSYFGGRVNIYKRKDRSYDLTWPVRTASQRLMVQNEAMPHMRPGDSTMLVGILRRCIEEFNDPRKFRGPDEDDE